MPTAPVPVWVATTCPAHLPRRYYLFVTFIAGLMLSGCEGWTKEPGVAFLYFGVPLSVTAVWIGTAVFWGKSAKTTVGVAA